MLMAAAAVVSDAGLTSGLLLAAAVFGLRHGVDWDHIAAISDITAANTGRRGLRLGTMYALGHGAVVFALGVLVIVAGRRLPASIDQSMGRVVGVTLLALGAAVVWSLLRDRADFRMRSRWLLLIVAIRQVARLLTGRARPHHAVVEHSHHHVSIEGFHHDGRIDDSSGYTPGTRLRAPTVEHAHRHAGGVEEYTSGLTIGVGMLHGVGAETPTQVVIFLAAANAGGAATGVIVLAVFLAGLFASNLAITLMGVFGVQRLSPRPRVHAALAVVTSVVSIAIGLALVMGNSVEVPLFSV